jgi:hypothetical protein
MEFPLEDGATKMVGDILSPTAERAAAGISAGRVREASLLTEALDELGHLTQSVEIQQMRGREGRKGRIRRSVRGTEGDGGMVAIRQPNDDIRSLAATDADDGELLPAERMMGMRDRHESGRGLG